VVFGRGHRRDACLIAAPAAALLLANAAWRVGVADTERLFRDWRSWDDVALASGYAARGEFPVAPYRVRDQVRRDKDPQFRAYRSWMLGEIGASGIDPLRFWKTSGSDLAPPDARWRLGRRFDDRGRALLAGIGFGLLHGMAPFLLFWLAVLAALPVLGWTAVEFASARRPFTGAVFLLALVCSTFVVELLVLGYSAAGFHLLAVLTAVPLATYAVFGEPTVRGLLARAGLAGCLLALCILCRGTAPLVLPGFVLAVSIGALRARGASDASTVRRLAVAAVAAGLLVLPCLGLRVATDRLVEGTLLRYGREPVPEHHDAALHVWKGLGDYDRTKGHSFRDKAVEDELVETTGSAARENEVVLREFLLRDIRGDPWWYAGILIRRVAATVSLYKLWPWPPLSGASIVPARSDNEGVTDNYYSMIAQADWIGLGPWTAEAPIALVLAPTLFLLGLCCLPRATPRWEVPVTRARRALPLLACAALAVLPTPVLITTATAFETECFVVVHLLALAFLVEALLPWTSSGAIVTS
jgi:hypothetical protein